MAKILTPPEALHRAAALCSSAEHCTADIREKLARWGVTEADSRTIIDRLVQERFIDEQRYAVAFVKDKFRFSGWGRIKMRYALQQKRIDGSDIDHALATLDEEQYNDRLLELLQAKSRSIRDDDPEARRAKLFRFATSRGFESTLIFNALKQVVP
ncbi:RecX family transcriptional regulator [Barnesiella sp. ET7]|uniref:regulatory protein RecX n=1 Tax=Barnesiella sp. ET7 TaxID=2972460 RepID=UPI0021ABBD30|nr:regulatory protein RecX [Barnesiella sp. ET7]MCR8911221.1 RecX family transcriptional regulator [Barnesiella sp. ET7]